MLKFETGRLRYIEKSLRSNHMRKTASMITLILVVQLAALSTVAQDEAKARLYLETGHTELPSSVIFSADGETVVSHSYDGTVKLWSASSGQELDTLSGFASATFSPDGSTIALTTLSPNKVKIWDVASWRVRQTLAFDKLGLVSFSPDGKTLAISNRSSLILWDVASERARFSFKHAGLDSKIVFSANWKRIALPTSYSTIAIVDSESGAEVGSLNTDPVTSWVVFSLDGELIANWSSFGIAVWQIKSGKRINFVQRNGDIFGLVLAPDAKTIAFTSRIGTDYGLFLWRVDGDQQPIALLDHTSFWPLPTFTADGKTLMIGAEGSVDLLTGPAKLSKAQFWDTASSKKLDLVDEASTLLVSPAGTMAASWTERANTMKVWDTSTWTVVKTLNTDFGINNARFLLNGKILAAFSENALVLWNTETGAKIQTLNSRFAYFPILSFSSDLATVASYTNEQVTLWDLKSGRPRAALKANAFPVKLFDLSPDGKSIAAWVWRDTVVKIWDLESGYHPRTLSLIETNSQPQHHSRSVKPVPIARLPISVIFSPDGKKLALLGTTGERLTVWDVISGEKLHTFNIAYVSFRFSPDSKLIALGGVNTITLYEADSGRQRRVLTGYDALQFEFSEDSKFIVSGSADNGIKVWNVESGWSIQSQERHAGGITSVTFAPDGKRVASAGRDQVIKIWDASSAQLIRTFDEQSGEVQILAFDARGMTIASGGYDTAIRLWDVESGRVLKILSVHDPTTPREVHSIVPGYYQKNRQSPTSPDGKFQVTIGSNGRINLLNLKSGQVWVSLISLGSDEWAVITPDGRFDTNKPLDEIEGLHWVINDEVRNPLPLDIFMRQYYEPRLLRKVLNGERIPPLPSIADINRVQPRVSIKNVTPAANGSVGVTVGVENVIQEVRIGATDSSKGKQFDSGVYDLRLFRDGQLVGYSTSDEKLQSTFRTYKNFDDELGSWREANKVDLVDGKRTFTFTIKLPRNSEAKDVEFSAYAFNEDRVKSETARSRWSPPEVAKAASTQLNVKPRAYVIAVGVNANENPAFDLQFAANDARRFQEVLPQRLAATGEYSEVVPISLISDWEMRRGQKVTTKRDATKVNFKAVLDLLAGRPVADEIKRAIPNAEKLARTTPDDRVLILFSSHGYADQSGNFYFIPYDTGPGACSVFTETVRQRSISSDELSLWLRDVDAGQMTLIVDACYSTAAIEGSGFKPGPMGSRGLGQLAYDKGMRILTATQADNVAMELPATAEGRPINHGLLSYALLEDGLGGNKADFKPHDKTIFMDEWLEYAVAEVPKLFASQPRPANETRPQSKLRNDGPRLVLLKRELSDPGVCGPGPSAGPSRIQEQQPSLFDFTRRKREVPLVRNP